MLFNTLDFLVFFLIVFLLYQLSSKNIKVQNVLLLISSYVFYGWWDPRFLFLITLSTYSDYIAGLVIGRGEISRKNRFISSLYLLVSVIVFIGIDWGIVLSNPLKLISDNGWFVELWSIEWKIIIATLLFLTVTNLCYPFVIKLKERHRKKLVLTFSVFVNLSLLGFFKYYNFFIDSFISFSEVIFNYTPNAYSLNIILPVGISFYTFQTMSYTIDVYRNEIKSNPYLIEFATYVAFFPQLVAGPIERAKHLLPQFGKMRPKLSWPQLKDSLWLIVWGLFKKVVVADNMANIVNAVFKSYDNGNIIMPENSLWVIIGVLAFTFQIYGDFSGYTDIARGVAKLLGFDIMLNFNLPYFAISPSDFWTRWHISLSSWLRDYLYIPLGGNRLGDYKTYRNLLLTMLLGGLWHGAAWTFILWGGYHGIILIVYRFLKIDRRYKSRTKLQSLVLISIMFVLTCYGWLIFRAQNFDTIVLFTKSIFSSNYFVDEIVIGYVKDFLKFSWFLIVFQFVQYLKKDLMPLKQLNWFVNLNVLIYIIMAILTISNNSEQEFIYFAF